MKFWDSSAVVALILSENSHARVLRQLEADPAILVWWATPVECVSALARREREGTLPSSDARIASARLRELAAQWQEIIPSASVRSQAERLLRIHPLRAGDAQQLAAAIVAAEGDPPSLDIVTFDERLKDCAAKEGFTVL